MGSALDEIIKRRRLLTVAASWRVDPRGEGSALSLDRISPASDREDQQFMLTPEILAKARPPLFGPYYIRFVLKTQSTA